MNGLNAPRNWRLVEVWGDTADVKHLSWSIIIGGVVSLAGYFVAKKLLSGAVANADLARAYAMLAGLGGCLVSGVICASLFEPKRKVVEEGGLADNVWMQEVLSQLEAQTGDLGSVADLPPEVVTEMKELHIYDMFATYKSGRIGQADSATKTKKED